jgi:asparagine N-glycosylation enzyme membrane subunit Stt3
MKLCGTGLLLAILLLGTPWVAYKVAFDRNAANRDWQAALSYLKHETPEDSVVLSWWDYGYWILDMGDRRSVVDNGLSGWDEKRLDDVGLAYCTSDPAVAAEVMRRYGAEYLVFSRVEGTLSAIAQYGLGDERGDDEVMLDDLKESLYYQSLNGGFQSGGGLKRVYPSPEVKNPQVVILALE